MLEPREADIPALFLVLVVLPLVAYFLLGKWSEASKKQEQISLLAQLAAEEALRAEAMAAASVIPLVPSSKNGLHACAWCFGPATTRCSRCKAVKYDCSMVDSSQVHLADMRSTEKRIPRKSNKDMLQREDATIFDSCEETSRTRASSSASNNISSKEAFIRHKTILCSSGRCQIIHWRQVHKQECLQLESTSSSSSPSVASFGESALLGDNVNSQFFLRTSGFVESQEGMLRPQNANGSTMHPRRQNASTVMHENHKHRSQCGNKSEPKSNYKFFCPPYSAKDGLSACEAENALFQSSENLVNRENGYSGESVELDCSGMTAVKECTKARSSVHSLGPKISKSPKLAAKVPGEQLCPEMGRKGQIPNELKVSGMTGAIPAQGTNGAASSGIMEMMGLKKSTKPARSSFSALCGERRKKIKMLFPYEEFVKFFQCEAFDLSPRGLLNIGNSCYANAVLQCLTFTKPLSIYLLRQSHSRACYGKDWCLMCELEQHVKCLRCFHESERHENIMDLTLEIYGWVESLEDALTQFTTPEDLDGENMYRCGRCAGYVRARKQLCIDEAPNILTIVLKRFQEGKYGKINKCITFPDMLDMVPFMTGTGDIPPLYMLYAVVVHLDTLNASFSGHYVSYVKDLRGNWFRIDDTEVRPVSMSQVMSEGAYILFYMR
ncbi:hypothetical protein GOBAR_AA27167 [Gossypium barbadense]|uniref:USP domain-containing protein n=1 Tax=Gossypium barbadense TaxID=3634 RepID=A0A2P5WR48_GOSBA|nr:hypothetical protein GOBAR_AA27167 [Gossypium barbadense]